MSDSERTTFAATTAMLAAVLCLAGLLLMRHVMILGMPLIALGVLGLAHSVLVGLGLINVGESRIADDDAEDAEDATPRRRS